MSPQNTRDFDPLQKLTVGQTESLPERKAGIGSQVVEFIPDNSNLKKAQRRAYQGQGVEILSGADGMNVWNGQGNIASPYPKITFLTYKDGPDATGIEVSSRTFARSEMYDGNILYGEFDAIEVNWSSTTAPYPLVLRVIEGRNRVVGVHTGEVHVPDRVWDWRHGSFTMITATQTLIYDDTDPGLFNGSGYAGVQGVGNSYRSGPHVSHKRRLHGMVTSEDSNHPNPTLHFYLLITAFNESDGTENFWWIGQSQTRDVVTPAFTAVGDSEIVRFGHMNAAQDVFNVDTQGVAVPPRFRIYGIHDFIVSPATFHMNMWFTGI